MCGIAGVIDLEGRKRVDPEMLELMASAIEHRGPDEDGFFYAPGVGLANRRLSIVGLSDGRQPIANEDGTVSVVFNGELFDYIEKKAELTAKGHVFRTHCDTEVLVHLWEEYGEGMLERLRGQFAFALYDSRRRVLILGRDRLGICPLHWARRGNWIYFGSEIKAILASGRVEAEADPRGLDTKFSRSLPWNAADGVRRHFAKSHPAAYVKIAFGREGGTGFCRGAATLGPRFSDYGDEYQPSSQKKLIEEFRRSSFAVEIRLRADVPVVGYLSGGVDSTTVVTTATKVGSDSDVHDQDRHAEVG
ncbi:MAG: asparagine synthetase B [Planctomycetota bacterium]